MIVSHLVLHAPRTYVPSWWKNRPLGKASPCSENCMSLPTTQLLGFRSVRIAQGLPDIFSTYNPYSPAFVGCIQESASESPHSVALIEKMLEAWRNARIIEICVTSERDGEG